MRLKAVSMSETVYLRRIYAYLERLSSSARIEGRLEDFLVQPKTNYTLRERPAQQSVVLGSSSELALCACSNRWS